MLCFFSIKSEWPSVVHCGGPFQVLFVVAALQLQKVSYFLYFTLVFFYLLSSLSKAGGTRHRHSGLDFQKPCDVAVKSQINK